MGARQSFCTIGSSPYLVRAYSEKGDSENAIEVYKATLRVNGDEIVAEAHAGLALELAQQGQNNEALVHFPEAERLKSEDGTIQLNLGWTYYLSGNSSEAKAHTQKALDRFAMKRDEANTALSRQRLVMIENSKGLPSR